MVGVGYIIGVWGPVANFNYKIGLIFKKVSI